MLYFTLQERRKETFFVKKRLYRSKTEQPAGGGVIDVDSEVREPSEKKEKYKGPEID